MSTFFNWIACTDKRRAHSVERPADSVYRLAQLTDPHIPSEITLLRRLRDLMRPHRSASNLSHELSAISNELSHTYRKRRKLYTNLLKKTLVGMRRIGVDHLLLTGDVAHCGLSVEFSEMRAIMDVTGWSAPERHTIIPGNHDRFNLYEALPEDDMESFFDVVSARQPRVKILPGGIAVFEIDSNCDRADDRQYMEKWLPNTIGKIYPETLDRLDAQRAQIEGHRLLVLIHHHVSTDWYPRKTSRDLGGLMAPAEGVHELLQLAELVDPRALLLHGHIHDAMPIGYTFEGHPTFNPGGFAETLRLNIIDIDAHSEFTVTQVELRD